MNIWLLQLLPFLSTGRIPQLGSPVQTTGPGTPGTPAPTADPPAQIPGQTPAQAPAQPDGSPGVEPPASADPAAASPQLGTIAPTTYYMLDESRPDERILGTQIREAIHRARQVDTLQSRLHQAENERNTLRTQLEETRGTLLEITETQQLQYRLRFLGIPIEQTGVQQHPSPGLQT